LAFDASGFAITGDLIRSSIPEGKEFFGPGPMIYMGGMRVYGALGFLAVLACLAPSAFFIMIIQDTAAGNDEIDWPDEVWYEYLTKIAFLTWLFGCCAAVSTVFWLLATLVVPIPGVIWWALVLLTAFMIFPIPLYSTMIAGSPFILIHPLFLLRMFQRPMAGLALYVHSLVLLVPCVVLGLWLVMSMNWWMSPMIGMFWATCVLWYGRALGRVGYVLAEEKRKVRHKKKRKKVRVRREYSDTDTPLS
jgi:hypothetical protein